MGINYFTDEQVCELAKNPNIKRVSNKAITYQEKFKEHFLCEYHNGKIPSQIFIESGFDITYLGDRRIDNASYLWRKQSERLEGVKDTRKGGSGRPRTKHLSKDEIIERQKSEIEYLKQERDFLLELKRLERQAIRKQQLSPKKNIKSSKK